MTELANKIDFALVFTVRNANPNGDPLYGNRPRTTLEGLGEVSDVCLKRKLRNRLQDMGFPIFVQSDDRQTDGCRSLRERADRNIELAKCKKEIAQKHKTRDDYADLACEAWYDVRAFGQVFAFSGNGEGSDGVSKGIRGPVTIQSAYTIAPVNITSTQITKSVNLETNADPDKKASDTMGMKHRVDFGVYVSYGSINVQTAEKTKFSQEDALALREALRTLFVNDATSARPDGSMEVVKVIWWQHANPTGQYSSAKVHRSLHVTCDPDGQVNVTADDLPGLTPEFYDGE